MLDIRDFEEIFRRLLQKGGADVDGLIDEDVLNAILPKEISSGELELLIDYLAVRGYYLGFVPPESEYQDEDMDYTNAFSSYVRILHKLTPLGISEEEALLERIAAGDKIARNLLLEGYLWMVFNTAREKGRKREEILEYIQEGNLGLLKALESFRHGGRKTFRDFARWHIRKAIGKYQKESSIFSHIPKDVLQFFHSFREIGERLSQNLSRRPDIEEISLEMGLPLSVVRENLLLGGSMTGHEAVLEDSDARMSRYIREIRAAEDMEIEKSMSLREALRDKIDILNPLEKEIVSLYYGLSEDEREYDFADIAEELGLKVGMVRDIESTALTKITLMLKEERNIE